MNNGMSRNQCDDLKYFYCDFVFEMVIIDAKFGFI